MVGAVKRRVLSPLEREALARVAADLRAGGMKRKRVAFWLGCTPNTVTTLTLKPKPVQVPTWPPWVTKIWADGTSGVMRT